MVSYGIALASAIIFFITKYFLTKVSNNEKKSKLIVKDTIGVFLSVLIGQFAIEQLEPLTNDIPDVTVSEPNF
jgi:hypothetical protein